MGYTYKDIIIDPTSKEAKNCIGREVYFGITPTQCLNFANNGQDDYCGILQKIETNKPCPFVWESVDACLGWGCMILKKEKPKKFIPFNTIKEIVEASLEHNKNHYLSKVGGIWLKNKESGVFELVTAFCLENNSSYFDDKVFDAKNLFDDFCFLDGTPCGKLKENTNDSI